MENLIPVAITRLVRRMRGASQSFTVRGDDGHFYVAKFQGNPQGHRTLINEWIGAALLSRLGVNTPEVRLLRLPSNLDTKDFFFHTPGGRQHIAGDLHLGSLYPVNPETTALYDWLPERLIETLLVNGSDFITTFIFDCWAGHSDRRQAVFHRNKRLGGVEASIIDHGQLFGGTRWKLLSSPVISRCQFPAVYRGGLDLLTLARKAADTIQSWTVSDLNELLAQIPPEWLDDGAPDAFGYMAEQLISRSEYVFVDIPKWLRLLKSYFNSGPIGRHAGSRPDNGAAVWTLSRSH